MKELFVGVDLHKSQFTTFSKEGKSQEGNFGKFPTTTKGYEGFHQYIKPYQEADYTVKLAVESTGNARFFKNTTERFGCEVIVVNPLKMKVITESVNKTDKHDAKTLAIFLEKDILPESILCSMESEQLRRLLNSRRTLTRSMVAIKNQLHGALLSCGLESLKGSLQSKKGRQVALDALTESNPDPVHGLVAQQLLSTIDLLAGQIKNLETVLKDMVQNDAVVTRLMTIPGCGLITASTIRASLDDISRYATAKKFAAYAGLTPWVQLSNESGHYGRITKRGPEELRTALVQLVLGMVRSRRTIEYRLMKFYRGKKVIKGSGKSIIATARKLAVVIWTMLTRGEDFSPEKMLDPYLQRKAEEMRNAS